MKKIDANQVAIGMRLSCDVYNEEGVLLLATGSKVENEQQLQMLAKEGFHSDLQEWVPAETPVVVKPQAVKQEKGYVYNSVVEALLEVQLPLNHIFDTFRADAFHKESRNLIPHIAAVVNVILDVCDKHPEESFATINMFTQGRYVVWHATSKSVVTCLICQRLGLPEKDRRRFAAAALTSNASITKLMEVLRKQQDGITQEQRSEYENHPLNSFALLTRAGIRDKEWLDAVLLHHERLDGNGFPRGMLADEITLSARIIAIADEYVTLILPKQTLQLALDPPSVLKHLYKKCGKQLDGSIVADVVNGFGAVPPGTFVKLKDGVIGVVISSLDDKEKPMIAKVGDDTKKFYTGFRLIGQYKIVEIIRAPRNLPKRLFRLWRIYENKRKSV